MKISEIIERLKRIQDGVGDLNVKVVDSDGEWQVYQVLTSINFSSALIFVNDRKDFLFKLR